ncbi:hypothetical protein PRB81_gp46 [Klebsiella phage VLCpiS13f]|uniref:hypothetical protein n=1 Tax=Klebsiella phage VLCpiS13f TaxID=2874890 RepID=UPI00233F534F|nr:hypothetical protein PRB81_gp46 [Klebsiella phage VLCpiS13f]UVX29559.1 hypothetical protein S13f_00050 [Klebsiella phage VLCpiS13f]
MKLIDILVEELPKNGGWLRDVKTMTQDRNGDIWGYDCVSPCLKGGLWSSKSGEDLVKNSKIEVRDLAVDWQTAIITREQYEAALAAKNDGWIDWPGGECPVPRGTLVDVKYLCGDVNRHIKAGEPDSSGSIDTAFAVRWSKLGAEYDIVAYRLHQPQEAEQAKVDGEADLSECIGQDAVPVWDGEGLPPVDCMCERSWAGDEWQRCKILFTSNQLVVIKLKESGREDAYNIGDVTFRPIRSQAERKREEAVQALCDAGGGNGKVDEKAGYGSCWFGVYDAIAAGKVRGVKLED